MALEVSGGCAREEEEDGEERGSATAAVDGEVEDGWAAASPSTTRSVWKSGGEDSECGASTCM